MAKFSTGIEATLSAFGLALLMLLVILFCVPKAYYDATLVYGRPVYQFVFVALASVAAVWVPFGYCGRAALWWPIGILLVSIAIATVAAWPAANATSLTISYDVTAAGAALAGMVLGLKISVRKVIRVLLTIHCLCAASLVISGALLISGVIRPMEASDRVYDQSMFFPVTLLAIIQPVAIDYLVRLRRQTLAWVLWAGTTSLCFAFGNMSATRSVILVSSISAIVSGARLVRGQTRWFLAVMLLVVGVSLVSTETLSNTFSNLSTRLANEGYSSGTRIEELQAMFDQLGWRATIGLGIGGAFFSEIVWEGNPDGLDWAPHIAIATPLLKGGLVALCSCVLWPAAIVGLRLLKGTSAACRALLTSIGVYLIQASVSGGYHYGPLLILGVLVGSYNRLSDGIEAMT
jgi:hypothetical protein